ncbi:MAG TPA: hypothetical protein DCM08_04195 [Microscillaceae bacterium]|jgi:hypothetical protein|nr:hypothetical protein [Microscillaceae bacterium]
MALYYNSDGSFSHDDGGADKTYLSDGTELPLRASFFKRYAAIVYAEAAGTGLINQLHPGDANIQMIREAYGIVRAMFNYMRAKNYKASLSGGSYGTNDLLNDTNQYHAIGSPNFNEFLNAPSGGDDAKRQAVVKALIKFFTRELSSVDDIDSSGVMYWDGRDLFVKGPNHVRSQKGIELSNSGIGQLYAAQGLSISSYTATNPSPFYSGPYLYRAVFAAGGTVFFVIHPDAVNAGIGV